MAPGAESNTPSVMHCFAHLEGANDHIVNEAFGSFIHIEQVIARARFCRSPSAGMAAGKTCRAVSIAREKAT